MLLQSLLLLLLLSTFYPATAEMTRSDGHHKRGQLSTFSNSSSMKLDFMANAVYNKLYQRSLNILQAPIKSIEPRDKVWFAIVNGTIFALPLFGDYAGPFRVEFSASNLSPCSIQFDFAPSSSLFSPSNHLLLALFNMSSTNYKNTPSHRYSIVRTLSLALNLTESLLTIHRINGSMIKVYFSCDFFSSSNLTQQIEALIEHYYSRRLQLLVDFPLPLIEISIVRLAKSSAGRTTTARIELRKATITIKPRLLNNRTVIPVHNNQKNLLSLIKQLNQPLVLIPLAIILIGLIICSIIACCLCCNRRSSSSSTLLLPSGPTGSPNNRHLYQNYTYRKHRQQQEIYKKKHHHKDQRQYISKGIPVVFAEELDEKLEQAQTPLVMRVERTLVYQDQEQNGVNKVSL